MTDIANLEAEIEKLKKALHTLTSSGAQVSSAQLDVLRNAIYQKEAQLNDLKSGFGASSVQVEIPQQPVEAQQQKIVAEQPVQQPVAAQPVEVKKEPTTKPDQPEDMVRVEIGKAKYNEIIESYTKSYEDVVEKEQLQNMIKNAVVANAVDTDKDKIERASKGAKIKLTFTEDRLKKEQEAAKAKMEAEAREVAMKEAEEAARRAAEIVIVEITRSRHDEIVKEYRKNYADIMEADQLLKMINNALAANALNSDQDKVQRVANGAQIKVVFIEEKIKQEEKEAEALVTDQKAKDDKKKASTAPKVDPFKYTKVFLEKTPQGGPEFLDGHVRGEKGIAALAAKSDISYETLISNPAHKVSTAKAISEAPRATPNTGTGQEISTGRK